MSPAEILNRAAVVLETRGWHRGYWVPYSQGLDFDACPVCVLGALNVAADYAPDTNFEEYDDRAEAAQALVDHLNLHYSDELIGYDGIDTIVYVIGDQWNDLIAESAEQVTTALREAAKAVGGAA